jgi:hypothetical protein
MPGWFAAAVASHFLAACFLALSVRPGAAQQPPRAAKQVSLSSLTAQGFEVKAAAGTQSGVISTLVLQKDKDVFLCSSVDLSIEPTTFECWPVK